MEIKTRRIRLFINQKKLISTQTLSLSLSLSLSINAIDSYLSDQEIHDILSDLTKAKN